MKRSAGILLRREASGLRLAGEVAGDLRYCLRALARSPAFTVVAVLSMALGTGANTAIFSLLDTVLLRGLPVGRPNELFNVKKVGLGHDQFSYPQFHRLRDEMSAPKTSATRRIISLAALFVNVSRRMRSGTMPCSSK